MIEIDNDNLIKAALSSTQNELLHFILERDNLSLDGVIEDYMKVRKEKILKEHPYTIFESKDGRVRTYVKDSSQSNGRRMIVKSSMDSLIDALIEHYNSLTASRISKDASLFSLYPSWIKYKSLHVEVTTIDRVQKDWRKYYEGASITHKPITTITKLDIDEWVHTMIRQHNMNKHKYGNFSLIIRQELDYAVDLGIIEANPFYAVKIDKKRVLIPERKKSDETQVFTENELNQIYQCAYNDYSSNRRTKHKLAPLATMFLFQTGMRLGEVVTAKFEDIDEDEIIVRRAVQYPRGDILDWTKGTYGDRRIPLTDIAKELIAVARKYQEDNEIDNEDYIFSISGNPVKTYCAIQKAFTKYCKDIGIYERSPHKARKTFISSLIDAGVNINTVRSIAGHKDEKTTYNNYCYDRRTRNERNAQVKAAVPRCNQGVINSKNKNPLKFQQV